MSDLSGKIDRASAAGDRGDRSGLGNMLVGGFICFIGLAITIGSYLAAEPGGMYLLAWGPVVSR